MTDTRALDRQGVVLIAGSLLVLGLVAGLVAWREHYTPALDPVTLRAAGRPVTGEVVILLDATDPPTKEQQSRMTEWFRELELSHLQRNERVTLWVLGAREDGGLARRFCRCFPGRETDPILHNPAASAAVCDSLFTRPLRSALTDGAGREPSARSPILEAVRELSQQPELSAVTRPRRLILVSDLEENMPGLCFYGRVPSFTTFRSSSRFGRLRADLRGVAVEVLYLPRGKAEGTLQAGLTDFWRAYLQACGASTVRFARL